jgi:transcription elongation factor GreA
MTVQCDVETVRVGSRVRLHDLDGEEDYALVQHEEADPFAGLVSAESPLGRALLGRATGDRVNVRAPGGVRVVTVVAVSSAY